MLTARLFQEDETLRSIADGQETLAAGASGPAVQCLQKALVTLGQTLHLDGSFGPKVRAAVVIFQSGNGLPDTGIVDAKTLLCMDARLMAKANAGKLEEGEHSAADLHVFSDESELPIPANTDAELAVVFKGLIQSDLSGANPGVVIRTFKEANPSQQQRIVFALADVMKDKALVDWIESSESRRLQAVEIALKVAPRNLSPLHNQAVNQVIRQFKGWNEYRYPLIIVPGYTPLDQKNPLPGVHPTAKRRLEQAMQDVHEKKAPIILVSGSNVYPRGTPYFEALEMKKALVEMGFPVHNIAVETRARHSTTNLRNAARFMLASGFKSALVTTMGGGILGTDLFDQDFYFSNPTLSTFHARCESELGYRVGELQSMGDAHTSFRPFAEVLHINYRDPLDP